jgi:hypothetical protein
MHRGPKASTVASVASFQAGLKRVMCGRCCRRTNSPRMYWRAKVICLAQDVRLCSKIATLYGHDLHDEGVRPAFTLWVWRQSTASKAVFRSAERIGLTRR